MTLPVDPHLYAAFLGVMLVMVVTPGPAILFAVATGVKHGRSAVVLATAGMNAANLCWFLAAAAGLSGLAAAFPRAFGLLRYAGVAYLAWLGVRAIWGARTPEPSAPAMVIAASHRAFREGFVVQITNPKALLFITAVLPPFIDPAKALAPQLALFAAGQIGLDAIAMLAYGFGGAALSARLTEPRFRQGFSLLTGILLLLAALLILMRR